MKRITNLVLSSLLWGTASFALAGPWEQAVTRVLAREEFKHLDIKATKGRSEGNGYPVNMRVDTKKCILEIDESANSQAAALTARVRPAHQIAFRESLVLREIAHCWRKQDNPERTERLLAVGDVIAQRPDLLPWYIRAGQQEGMFADIAALSWVETAHPDSYTYLLTSYILWREGQILAGHTGIDMAGLQRTRKYGMIYGETPFYAADTTLAMVRKTAGYRTSN